MSVLFTNISEKNPVTPEVVKSTYDKLGFQLTDEETTDFTKLLAAVHDIAESVDSLEDYHPPTDLARFPRKDVHHPSLEENTLGHAWSYKFSIKDTEGIKGPLTGKTLCLKDNICVAGVPQVLGTEILDPWTPEADATCVRWALESGVEVVGTATCENWCQSTSSNTSAQGTIHNPHAEGYSAGGSTSGAAAIVGGGYADLAIGADQGGSIRVPAALCGIVGLKPTHGLVPYTGMASNDAINDHAGPMARTVLETAQLLDAISGYDGIDDRGLGAPKHGSTSYALDLVNSSKDLKGFKVGVLTEAYDMATVTSSMKSAVLAAAHKFSELGATVEEVSVPLHPLGNAIWTIEQRISGSLTLRGFQAGRRVYGLSGLEAARHPWTQSRFEKCYPTTKNVLGNGTYLIEKFPGLYPKILNLGRKLRDAYEEKFKEYDVLILPTTSFVAKKHAPRMGEKGPIETMKPTIGLTANTVQFDATGQPAMSLPVGWLPAEEDESVLLPVGMQIVGGLWQDGKVLRAGYAWERAFDWKKIGLKEEKKEGVEGATEKLAAVTAES